MIASPEDLQVVVVGEVGRHGQALQGRVDDPGGAGQPAVAAVEGAVEARLPVGQEEGLVHGEAGREEDLARGRLGLQTRGELGPAGRR